MKNIGIFYLKIFPFLVVNISIYLNRRVFVMVMFFLLSCGSYIGIKHGFSCIKIRQVQREVLKTEATVFSTPPKGPGIC